MVYDRKTRIKAGFKRFIKVIIPLIPQLIDILPKVDMPYKNSLTAILVFIVAMEKAIQKDRSK